MVDKWTPQSVVRENWGHFQIVVTAPGEESADVTYFRGVPTMLESFSSGDPFGDAAAQIVFPQITVFDDIGQGELYWLRDWANVDIYFIASPGQSQPSEKVWEGMIASIEISGSGSDSSITATCIGALYQLDLYVRAPGFMAKELRNETLITQQFSKADRPHLRTQECQVIFPDGWNKFIGSIPWTGFMSRNTGAWDRVLTGYIQNLLSIMQTDDGRQWTMTKFDNRRPCLYVRKMDTVQWTLAAGTPGVDLDLTRDLTQTVNVIYGEGVDVAGTTWRNSKIADDGSVTHYDPIAFDNRVHGAAATAHTKDTIRVESHFKFDVMSQQAATESAEQIIKREKDPGFYGTITLKIDPEERSRYLFEAGHNLRLRYFYGTGYEGIVFHVASVEVNVPGQSVTLTVDTKARDLLTLQEIIMRNRDGKTPSRMLQVNRESQRIEDTTAPWDYTAGSGYIPKQSMGLWKTMPVGASFPYTTQTTKFPPSQYPQFYIKVKADAALRKDKWSTATIITSQSGTIRQMEIAAYDENGAVLAVPFHVSFYKYDPRHGDAYPKDASGPSPFLTDAFKSDASALLQPDPSMIIGWGDGDQKAGYWPGLASEDDPVTGKLKDEGTWQYTQDDNALTRNAIYIAIYCEHTKPVFFHGRLFKGVT